MALRGFPERILGVETEYEVGFDADTDEVRAAVREVTKRILEPYPAHTPDMFQRLWTRNGGRLYKDCRYMEGATPEVTSGWAAAAYDRALEEMYERRIRVLRQSDWPWLRMVRNNTTPAAKTLYDMPGFHENYLVAAGVPCEDLARRLAPFLVTRQIIGGAGAVVKNTIQDGWKFQLSQRSRHIRAIASASTITGRLGLIKFTNISLADRSRYQRLQIICGDSNILVRPEVATLDMTLLMLLLLENDALPEITLRDEVVTVHRTSEQGVHAELQLDDGRLITPVELQRIYLEAGLSFAQTHGLTQFESSLRYWGQMLDALANDELERCYGQIDWVTKWFELRRRDLLRADFEEAKQFDQDYHTIVGGSELPNRLRAKFDPPELAAAVIAADQTPPRGRAQLRAALLELLESSSCRSVVIVGWDRLHIHDRRGRDSWFYTPDGRKNSIDYEADLGDPYNLPIDALSELMAFLQHPAVAA